MNNAIYPLTLYYDGACRLCNAEMSNLKLRNHQQLLRFVDISITGEAGLPQGVSWQQATSLIQAQRADGQIISGVEVFRRAYDAVGIHWVSRWTQLPLIGQVADAVYPWIAKHRNRFPAWITSLLFEKAIRQAAKKAAAQRCTDTSCDMLPH